MNLSFANDRPSAASDDFVTYLDDGLSQPLPLHGGAAYFRQARSRLDWTVDLFAREIRNAEILDIGASPFYMLDRALSLGATRVSGTFFAHVEHPLNDISKIYTRHGAIDVFRCDLEQQDIPVGDNSFDIVTACEVLEHFEYFPLRFANEIRRVLRPNGLLCITVPNVASIGNILKLLRNKNIFHRYCADPTDRHKHEYTMDQLHEFVNFLGMTVDQSGFVPFSWKGGFWIDRTYFAMSKTPLLSSYSPTLFVLARQPDPKPEGRLDRPPASLYREALPTGE